MNGQTLALNNSWLDMAIMNGGIQTVGTMTTSNNASYSGAGGMGQLNSLGCYPTTPNYSYPSYYYWTTPAPRPIKLAMSEIERLRKAAKADDKLKAILAKFTGQIEIVVDFD